MLCVLSFCALYDRLSIIHETNSRQYFLEYINKNSFKTFDNPAQIAYIFAAFRTRPLCSFIFVMPFARVL